VGVVLPVAARNDRRPGGRWSHAGLIGASVPAGLVSRSDPCGGFPECQRCGLR
jgi:hypothetical protein